MFGGGGDQPAGQAVPGSGLKLRKSAPVGGRKTESGPRTGSGETRSGSEPDRRDAGMTRRSAQSERQNESPPPGGWRAGGRECGRGARLALLLPFPPKTLGAWSRRSWCLFVLHVVPDAVVKKGLLDVKAVSGGVD